MKNNNRQFTQMAYILIKNLFDTYSSFRVMFGQGSLCKREQKEITPK